MSRVSVVACHDCDLLSRLPDVPEGASVTCPRCGGLLRRRRRKSIERTLAASVPFAVANAFPFLRFEMRGRITETTLATGVFDLWDQGVPAIALLVGFTAVLAPGLQLALLLYVLLPVQLGRVPWQMARMFRLLRRVQPWSMMEIFLVGILGSPLDPSRIFASQTSSWFGQVIQRSDDGGEAWAPVGNEFAYEGVPGTHQWYDGTPHPWEFARVWHLEPSLTDPDVVYAGVEDAALFRSVDFLADVFGPEPAWDAEGPRRQRARR
jgi:hypothetical protein